MAELHTDHLAELDQHFAAGDMDGVRAALRDLPSSSRQALERLVGGAPVRSFTSRESPPTRRGSVFVLHGMMGSELFAAYGPDQDHVWLNPLRLMGGDLRRLRVGEDGRTGPIVPGGLRRSYLPLVIALDQHWDVVPTAYDWRLPLSASAELFEGKIREHFDDKPGPAHVVAHSTGGLVARMLLATRRPLWDQMDSPADRSLGGRLVMLGTPNLGSFAIAQILSGQDGLVRWLASIDVGSSADEIRQVLLSFPGAYELLTSSAASIENSGHALLYDGASWEEGFIDERLLEGAKRTHELLAAKGVDPDRTYYVAGSGHETPAAVRVDGRGRFSFRMTQEGDGRVPHALGFPVDDAGSPTVAGKIWYTTAGHGDLPREKEVICGVVDLLRNGSTARLGSRPPAGSRSRSVRGADWVTPDKVEQPRPLDLDAATDALRSPVVGRGERRRAAQRAASAAVEGGGQRSPGRRGPVGDAPARPPRQPRAQQLSRPRRPLPGRPHPRRGGASRLPARRPTVAPSAARSLPQGDRGRVAGDERRQLPAGRHRGRAGRQR